jgi:hypothetical protein
MVKLKVKVIPIISNRRHSEGVQLQLCSFLNSVPEGDGWPTPRLGRERTRYPLRRRLCESHSLYGRVWRKIPVPTGVPTQKLPGHTESLYLLIYTASPGSRDSSVSILTRYGRYGPGIESRWARDFTHLSRPILGPTQPASYATGTGSFPG